MTNLHETQGERILARATHILALDPIPGADRIECATILGYKVVVGKDQFQVGDLVIYFAIDSILDKDNPEFKEFTKPIKTKKIRGVYSQGLVEPVSIVEYYGLKPGELKDDQDLTKELKVEKHEEDPLLQCRGSLPLGLRKTGENRIEECTRVLREMKNQKVIITMKYHGTSASYYWKDGTFLICGRNTIIDPTDTGKQSACYLAMAKKHDLEKQMQEYKCNIAIQGEIVGPGILKNTLVLKELEFHPFYIWNLDTQRKYPYDEFLKVMVRMKLTPVKLLYRGPFLEEWTKSTLLEWADSLRYPKYPAEGLVMMTEDVNHHHSFKAISRKFLVKWK